LEIVKQKEQEAKEKFLKMVVKYPFEMKLLDTVYQLDGNKLTFSFLRMAELISEILCANWQMNLKPASSFINLPVGKMLADMAGSVFAEKPIVV